MIHNRPQSGLYRRARLRAITLLAIAATVASACGSGATSPPASTPAPTVERRPIPDGPVLLRDGITLRRVLDVGSGNIRLVRDASAGQVYLLNPAEGIYRVELASPASISKVASLSDIRGASAGMTVGPEGMLFVVANQTISQTMTQAVIRRGNPAASGRFTWETLALTEPYPASGTQFDHLFNGIVVSPDGKWLFVNSGSRTDHGEVQDNRGAFPGAREVALTAKIFRIPADATELVLPNDEAELARQGLIFAWGTRNAYDPEFAPNGELFAGDNGPDADYPDELDWIREGQHYGFPWRFGIQDNPQQFAGYDGSQDVRLHPDFFAVKSGLYRNDPGFPKPPTAFADPAVNLGPDAAQYRGDDGLQHDAAAEGQPLYTFTPHRSPLGLVFITDARMPAGLRADDGSLAAFVLSWGSAGGTLSDIGQDLLHLTLTKRGDNYEVITTQIARDFKNPIDAVMIENRLYVLEWGENGAIWELTFE